MADEPDRDTSSTDPTAGLDFVRTIIEKDLRAGRHETVATRFPPEPNGYLHIGHAKAICLDFGVADEYGGTCNLRFDDTNPTTEDVRYAEAIQRDVRWLGFEWTGEPRHASDYFERLYGLAEQLIRDGWAYVDSQSEEEIRHTRGTVTEPGTESPYRDRPIRESLELFRRMRAGEFDDGEHVLRARIDMAAGNMKMRDPLLYRIRHATHYRTGDEWCIYPMYDWAHPLSDAIEGITHSLCTLEFETNRELYDWVVDHTRPEGGDSEPGSWDPRPRQYEFARLNLDYTIMSKRKLARLVDAGHVEDWDDPRMPTLAGLRRRGVTPESIRSFCDRIGVARAENRVDIGLLESVVRDDLNFKAPRVMCVLRPLKVVITNYPEERSEELDCPHWPRDVPREGSRKVPFSREILIERDDFTEDPPEGYHRLSPGREVRLRYGYFIECQEAVKDPETGEVVELRCTYDPATRGGSAPDGRKVRGTLHWVSARHAVPVEVRLYDRLFEVPDPEAGDEEFVDRLNPESLEVVHDARIEPSVADAPAGARYQFERQGYFIVDPERGGFNRIVALRDTWSKSSAERRDPADDEAGDASPEPGPGADEPDAAEHEPRTRDDIVAGLRERSADAVARFRRYADDMGIAADDAELLAADPELSAFFDSALHHHGEPQSLANWVVNELRRELKEREIGDLPFGAPELARLVALVDDERITGPVAKGLFDEMIEEGGDPEELVETRGLERLADRDDLEPLIDRVLDAHPDKVEAYRGGHEGLLGFFMGRVMDATEGTADPQLAKELLRDKLSG